MFLEKKTSDTFDITTCAKKIERIVDNTNSLSSNPNEEPTLKNAKHAIRDSKAKDDGTEQR